MKRHVTSRMLVVIIMLALMLTAAACGQKAVKDPDATTGAGNGQSGQVNDPGDKEPEQEKLLIKVYRTDEELLEMLEQSAEISFEDEVGKVKAALEELKKDGENNAFSLWGKVELLGVKLDNGALTIDVHVPDDARLGGPGEEMAIEALKKTVFQFNEIESLEITVDGQTEDSLMGHVELEHPFVKQ